jgi:membrane-associated phospholipid phosphatase
MSAMRARSTIALPLAVLVLWTLFAPSVSTASVPTVLRESAVAAGIVGVSFALDGVIHPNVPDRLPGELVEEPGEITGNGAFLFGGTAALAVAGLVAGSPGAVHTARDLGLALTATSASVWLLKLTTHRERPDGSNHYSFPSGHTATAFAAASVLEHHYGWLAGLGAYTAAAMAGEARVADNHHYFSDVMAGAVLGTVIGHLVAHAP